MNIDRSYAIFTDFPQEELRRPSGWCTALKRPSSASRSRKAFFETETLPQGTGVELVEICIWTCRRLILVVIICICTCVCVYIYLCICLPLYMYTHLYMYMYMHMYAYACKCMFVCTYVSVGIERGICDQHHIAISQDVHRNQTVEPRTEIQYG